MSNHSVTDGALLGRLQRADDEKAWQEFDAIYRSRIYGICFAATGDEPSAKGQTDAIVHHLRTAIPLFKYDPAKGRFRGWLATVVKNALRQVERIDAPGHLAPRGGTKHLEAMAQMRDPHAVDANALSETIVEELHKDARLRRQLLFNEALDRVRQRLRNPTRWKAFWEVKANDRSPTEVAEELNWTRAATTVAASDLERMLRQELTKRINRLLADAKCEVPSEELASYVGLTVEKLREKGVQLTEMLAVELSKLLDGLTAIAIEGKSASATARELDMLPSDCGHAASRLGELVDSELENLEKEEAATA